MATVIEPSIVASRWTLLAASVEVSAAVMIAVGSVSAGAEGPPHAATRMAARTTGHDGWRFGEVMGLLGYGGRPVDARAQGHRDGRDLSNGRARRPAGDRVRSQVHIRDRRLVDHRPGSRPAQVSGADHARLCRECTVAGATRREFERPRRRRRGLRACCGMTD